MQANPLPKPNFLSSPHPLLENAYAYMVKKGNERKKVPFSIYYLIDCGSSSTLCIDT